MKRSLGVGALVGISSLAMAAPAQADVVLPPPGSACEMALWAGDNYRTMPGKALCWPQDRHEVVIENPGKIWGMRSQARYIDSRVGGLTIHSLRTDTCEAYPQAFCVKVVHKYLAPPLLGEFRFTDWPTSRQGQITLSLVEGKRMPRLTKMQIAGHELLHALGFSHHRGRGAIGDLTTLRPSQSEIDQLRAHYG